jgi:hypothetical protein
MIASTRNNSCFGHTNSTSSETCRQSIKCMASVGTTYLHHAVHVISRGAGMWLAAIQIIMCHLMYLILQERNIASGTQQTYLCGFHNDYMDSLRQMVNAPTAAEPEAIGFNQGLREPPLLCCVNSLDFVRPLPWDFMHRIFENICPLMVDHWTGKFKNLNAVSYRESVSQ